jgi:SNF2 family DNA or RNA helicase
MEINDSPNKQETLSEIRTALSEFRLRRVQTLLGRIIEKEPTDEGLQERKRLVDNVLEQVATGAWAKYDGFALLQGGFRIPEHVFDKLMPHQKDGIKWLYGRWKVKHTCGLGILADEMGLGKTVQAVVTLLGLIISNYIHHALVVVPLGLLDTWEKHLQQWIPSTTCLVFHGSITKTKRGISELRSIINSGGVVVTTYDAVKTNEQIKSTSWHMLIVDEGHYLKNHRSQRACAIKEIPAEKKLLLSGTPLQNNLDEVWSLFDFLTNGEMLGAHREFVSMFANPINAGSAKDASQTVKAYAEKTAQDLRDLISPLFLRREKTVLKGTSGLSTIGAKVDLVVWTDLSPLQKAIYQQFLTSSEVQAALNRTSSPFGALSVLYKILAHPQLLTIHEPELHVDAENVEPPGNSDEFNNLLDPVRLEKNDIDAVEAQSQKVQMVIDLLTDFRNNGHRALLFSQSSKMLDILCQVIKHHGFTFVWMDGSVSVKERQELIEKFNSDDRVLCFLLTTKLGIGITLTGADRVIMYDSSWNPSQDAQSVDRSHRVGQTRNVVVYRLVGCGTYEEKIYRNQIRKLFLAKTLISKSNQRYFSSADLVQLFTLDDTRESKTELVMGKFHPVDQGVYEEAQLEMKRVVRMRGAVSLSRHDTLFSVEEDVGELDDQVKRMISELENVGKKLPGTPKRLKDTLQTKRAQGVIRPRGNWQAQTPRGTFILDSSSDESERSQRPKLVISDIPYQDDSEMFERGNALPDNVPDRDGPMRQMTDPNRSSMGPRYLEALQRTTPSDLASQIAYATELIDLLLK